MLFILSVLLALGAFVLWRTASRRVAAGPQAARQLGGLAGIGTVLFALLALAQCFVVVRAGHVGVVDFFGTSRSARSPRGSTSSTPSPK